MSQVPLTNDLLTQRNLEITAYLEFLNVAVERPAVLMAKNGELELNLTMDLTHTLKANLVLLLYSVMEAALVQLLDEMHEEIGTNCTSADNLNEQLLKLVMRTVKKDQQDAALLPGKPLHESLFAYWISDWQSRPTGKEKRGDGISGSVDSLVFYKQLKKFGVVAKTDDDRPPSHLTSPALQKVKNNRNELAHGEKSFTDLGRDLAVPTLESDAKAIFETLSKIAFEVDRYLQERRYLASPVDALAADTAA
jgi:MAE_28990/MAE_18760-like HEPN